MSSETSESLTLKQANEALDAMQEVATGSRSDPRRGVTAQQAYFYDKGWDDAVRAARNALRLAAEAD